MELIVRCIWMLFRICCNERKTLDNLTWQWHKFRRSSNRFQGIFSDLKGNQTTQPQELAEKGSNSRSTHYQHLILEGFGMGLLDRAKNYVYNTKSSINERKFTRSNVVVCGALVEKPATQSRQERRWGSRSVNAKSFSSWTFESTFDVTFECNIWVKAIPIPTADNFSSKGQMDVWVIAFHAKKKQVCREEYFKHKSGRFGLTDREGNWFLQLSIGKHSWIVCKTGCNSTLSLIKNSQQRATKGPLVNWYQLKAIANNVIFVLWPKTGPAMLSSLLTIWRKLLVNQSCCPLILHKIILISIQYAFYSFKHWK